MMAIRRRHFLAGLGALSTALPFAARPAGAQELPKLRVAYLPFAYSAQVLYAQEMGFFTKAGISVEFQQIAYGAAVATAVAADAVDIGIATITTLAIAHSKNIPFTIVAPAAEFVASQAPTGYLMVGNQTTIHTGKDMNGKTVGTPGLATLGEYGVRYWVDVNGGDSTTLKFQEMPFSQMPAAFAAGRIDAAFIGEPFLSDAQKVARPLAREMDSIAPAYVITAWFAMAPWAAAHPDLIVKFNRALGDADTWAAKNPQQCVQILAKTFKLDPTTIAQSGLPTFPQRITPALIDAEIAVTAKYGKFPRFPAQDLIYAPRG
jgi:NitT/TauT family transport system substrate-binding protein